MPIFRVKSVKIYTGQKNLHWRRQWRQWQLSGMPWGGAHRLYLCDCSALRLGSAYSRQPSTRLEREHSVSHRLPLILPHTEEAEFLDFAVFSWEQKILWWHICCSSFFLHFGEKQWKAKEKHQRVGMEPLKAVLVVGETAGIGIKGIVSLKLFLLQFTLLILKLGAFNIWP